jgi:SAM-dependent methyltransferase
VFKIEFPLRRGSEIARAPAVPVKAATGLLHRSSSGGLRVFKEKPRMSTDRDTVRSYDAVAAEYAAEAAAMPEWVATEIDAFATALGRPGRVLEIGSGGGRDALELEQRAISVRRTDIAKGFVELLRESGFQADLLDPLTDDLADPQRPGTPYDGIWACACLIHVAREDLGTVLGRLAAATRTGGRLHASVREGDGEGVSTHGSAAAPRRYIETYWREPALRSVLTDAGWIVSEIRRCVGRPDDRWLSVRAGRA